VRVRTDDEVYRVDAVWLGPPKATFPWRARYVAWGIGILVFLLVFSVERGIGFGIGFFPIAWCLVITVVLTRFLGSRISHERPLGAVLTMWARELNAPRERAAGQGGATGAGKVRVHSQRPLPKAKRPPEPPTDRATPHVKPAKPKDRKPVKGSKPVKGRKPAKGQQPPVRGGRSGHQAGRTDPRTGNRTAANPTGRPQRVRQQPPRGQNVPYVQNAQPPQGWPGQPGELPAPPARTGHGGGKRTARGRSKEVGGVRTPGRR
jgi:hypothetical protein